jgi:hypothetical protein
MRFQMETQEADGMMRDRCVVAAQNDVIGEA